MKSLPKPLQRRGCLPPQRVLLKFKIVITFDCWSNNYSNKHVSLHANYPLLLYASCVGKDIPSFGGAWGGFPRYSVTRYTLHFYTSHVNKGIKFVEFKGKKGIINKE